MVGFLTVHILILPPLVYISLWLLLQVYGWRLRSANEAKRAEILENLGHNREQKKRLVGFFHPYW